MKTYHLGDFPIATGKILSLGRQKRETYITGYHKHPNDPSDDDLRLAVQENLNRFAYRYLRTAYDEEFDGEDPEDFMPFFYKPAGARIIQTDERCPDIMEAVFLIFGPGHAIIYSDDRQALHDWQRPRLNFPNAVGYVQSKGRTYAVLKIG